MDQILTQAKSLHHAGRLADAERLYRQVLAVDPAHAETLYLLGAACYALGKPQEAVTLLDQAVRRMPGSVDARHLLGVVLTQLDRPDEAIAHLQEASRLRPPSAEISNSLRAAVAAGHYLRGLTLAENQRLDEAIACYRQALALDPRHVPTHGNLGNALKQLGQLDEAAACYRRVLELAPGAAQAYNDLGLIAHAQNRWDDAAANFRRAIALDAHFAEPHTNLGNTLFAQGKLDEAEAACRRACTLRPDYADAHADLGALLVARKKYTEAADVYRRLVQLKPGAADALNRLGAALSQDHRPEEAADAFRQALGLDPNSLDAHNNLGTALADVGLFDDAIACYRRALEIKPDFAEAYYNLANSLRRQNKLEEAWAVSARALELKPLDPDTHAFRGLLSLTAGRFVEGWPEYEWRLKSKGFEYHPPPEPRWDGSPLAGRTIMLRAEQGHGDTMQFIRYAPLVKQQGGIVFVECQPSLARLLARTSGVDQVIAHGQPRPQVDVQLPLMSLPGVFQTSIETVPAQIPYLFPDPEAVARWKSELGQDSAFKIGIAWQGNPEYQGDRFRSIPLTWFARLARTSGVQLYSLQWGKGREQLTQGADPLPIVDLGERLGDFAETAAIISNLDLVISSDSAAVHLAGGLGATVWMPLAFSPDWRWMLKRADSPWYPTMRLFRQPRQGDWESVFQSIQDALAEYLTPTREPSPP